MLRRILPAGIYPVRIAADDRAMGTPAVADRLVVSHETLGPPNRRASVWLNWMDGTEIAHTFYLENVEDGAPLELSVARDDAGFRVHVHATYPLILPPGWSCGSSLDVVLSFGGDGRPASVSVHTAETVDGKPASITRCVSNVRVGS